MKNFVAAFSLAAWMAVGSGAFSARAADPPPTYVVQSGRQPGQIDRVVIVLEVAGDHLEKNNEGSNRVAMSGAANLSYDEKNLDVAATPEGHLRSARSYDKAEAIIKVGEASSKPALRPERRLIAVDLEGYKATLFSPRGLLTDEEMDLIDVSGNTLLLDQVLPSKPAAVGEKWKLSEKLLAALLGLDDVRHSDVECLLKEVTPALARMELAGHVSGTANGAASEIDLKAKCRFDRKTNRIDWFAMLIGDKREISPVEYGLDVVARVQIRISPKAESAPLAETATKDIPAKPTAEMCQLLYQPADRGWQVTHDRGWFLVDSRHDLAVMRLMAQGTDVAQCNISPLPKVAVDKLPTLPQFQNDVQHSLGKNFGQFVEAGQSVNEAKNRVYRVLVNGEVSEVPIRWQYYLVADEEGRQVAFTFTVKAQNLEAFGKAGDRLVDSLRFLDAQPAGVEKK